jgi:hypothetical protein
VLSRGSGFGSILEAIANGTAVLTARWRLLVKIALIPASFRTFASSIARRCPDSVNGRSTTFLGSHVFCVPHQENRLLRDGNPYRSETPLTIMILSIALFIRLHPNWLLIWRPRKQLRIRVPVHDPPSCLLAPKYHRGA